MLENTFKAIKGFVSNTPDGVYDKFPWLKEASFEEAEVVLSVDGGCIFEWRGGTWNSGTWMGSTWGDGKLKNVIWKDGTWLEGTWNSGTWHDGTWCGGTWERGEWCGGAWEGGTWKGGIWKRGKVVNPITHRHESSSVSPAERFPVEYS